MTDTIDEERRLAARAATRDLAQASLAQGAPTAWFEEVYARADGDGSSVPWANLAPHALLVGLLERVAPQPGARILVPGCGLGDDAAECARRGLDIQAFDLSPSAVRWARRRHPELADRFGAQDLLHLPEEWSGRFDLVAEVYTLQSLPFELRSDAFGAMARTLKPGGALLAVARALPADVPLEAPREGPPWPLARAEFEAWATANDMSLEHAEDFPPPSEGFGKQALVLRRAI